MENEKFYFEEPSIKRKEEAIEYINEHYKYNSKINGSGSLHKYINNYEGWLEKLNNDKNRVSSDDIVPALTYFLIRKYDDKIVGMINIRLRLNDKLKKYGGHIGYGIRPTERVKGYNKINLYLALKVLEDYGNKDAMLQAETYNIASWKTMESLGGIRTKTFDIDKNGKIEHVYEYHFNIRKCLEDNKDTYEKYIFNNKKA